MNVQIRDMLWFNNLYNIHNENVCARSSPRGSGAAREINNLGMEYSMEIDSKQVMLTLVALKLGSKKITSSMLDQIPRLDFCELLLDEDDCFCCNQNIVPVARFSLVLLLNSQRRVFKAKGYDSEYTRRLIKHYDHQEEAFLFNYNGQLYCDSFSSKTATQEYGNQLTKLKQKLGQCDSLLASASRVLDLEEQGVDALEIARKCSTGRSALPLGRKRGRLQNILDDWDDDVLGFGESDEKVASHNLNVIMKNYGSWDEYIKAMKQDVKMKQINKAKLERDIDNFEEKVSTVINEIISSPFTIFGC